MGLRPAKSVRAPTNPPYTRVSNRVMKKSFIRGVPGSKMHTFQTGKRGLFGYKVTLVATKKMVLRHNQLEAARVAANGHCTLKLGLEGYFMKVYVYPHQVIRENALATGAGADRFQSGMSRAFGKPTSTGAVVKNETKIMALWVPADKLDVAKEAFRRAAIRLSVKTKLVVEKGAMDSRKAD